MQKSELNSIEEIPDELLFRLIEAGVKGCMDNDKIRMNAGRALGNLLQLITVSQMKQVEFRNLVEKGICDLVANCSSRSNMKVFTF